MLSQSMQRCLLVIAMLVWAAVVQAAGFVVLAFDCHGQFGSSATQYLSVDG